MRHATTLFIAAMVGAGCYLGSDPPEPAPKVGPSPLRRMSNAQYLNALHDLFPTQSPVLPPLPNDTVVAGFENAAEAQQPSDVRIARYEAIANVYADGATRDAEGVRALVGCDTWATPSLAAACADGFLDATGRRVFRRPLTDEERARFKIRFAAWEAAVDFEAAVRLTLSAMLQSPQFIYRAEPVATGTGGAIVPVESYALASRLSFFLWESIPDATLLDAAARGELRTEAQIRAQAERMLADDRARRVLWNFHRQWLGLDRVLGDEQLYRTPEIDPAWTPETPRAAAHESELFVENVLMERGSLRDLLLSRRAWVNGEMARIYGVSAPVDPGAWAPVLLPEGERAGLLTRVAFLAGTSHRGGTSPPLRGNAVLLRLLCQMPTSPPPGADLSMPTAPPELGPQTTRMLFEARTAPAPCRGCHVSLNGVGFGFEHYDAAGAYRAKEEGLSVDASGKILGTDVDRPFDGALALSVAMSESHLVSRCATQQWMRYALGRAPVDDEAPLVDALAAAFDASGGDVRALLLGLVTSPTFRLRQEGR